MRILYASDVSIARIEGGSNRVLFHEATGMAARGHDVSIITREVSGGPPEARIGNVREYRYAVNQANPATYIVSTVKNSRRLFETLSSTRRFDILHFHQPFSAFGVLRSGESRNVRKIYTCHSLAFEEYETRHSRPPGPFGRMSFWLHSRGRKFLERSALRQAETVLTLSGFMKDRLMKFHGFGGSGIEILPGGVDVARFRPGDNKSGLRQKLKLPPDRLILFTVRNLVPRMGLENLVRSMKQVRAKSSEPYLIIGGKGPLKTSLENLIRREELEQSVRLVGYIAEEDLPSYFQAADWFVLPTLCLEGFGLVTVEALASGLPVLGTPVGATPEILGKLDSDLLFRDAEPGAMADRIIEQWKRFKGDPGGYAALAGRCRSLVEREYTWERHLASLERVYERMATGRGN